MRIDFVSQMDGSYASYRYRMLMPARELEKHGHTVTFNQFARSGASTVVFSKHFNYGDIDVAVLCKNRGKRIIFDVCDNHFGKSPHRPHYIVMCQMADKIIAGTPEMATAIKEATGMDATVIPDPYEFKEVKPEVRVLEDSLKLLWYGHASNLPSLMKIWPTLKGHRVMIVSDPKYSNKIGMPIVQWSKKNMVKAFEGCDAVIIPTQKTGRHTVKGANRMVEAIRQGKFVIAGDLPAYEQFRNWMWTGDIAEGIEWFKANPEEAAERVKWAQSYVNNNFSPERIGNLWNDALHEGALAVGA
ncbi:hypothetical protein KAR91_11735 [Candidatus Pacearchaeota archaeon]|nr:hypothetical protein [Candidatus Pacearchaeota archaeon]